MPLLIKALVAMFRGVIVALVFFVFTSFFVIGIRESCVNRASVDLFRGAVEVESGVIQQEFPCGFLVTNVVNEEQGSISHDFPVSLVVVSYAWLLASVILAIWLSAAYFRMSLRQAESEKPRWIYSNDYRVLVAIVAFCAMIAVGVNLDIDEGGDLMYFFATLTLGYIIFKPWIERFKREAGESVSYDEAKRSQQLQQMIIQLLSDAPHQKMGLATVAKRIKSTPEETGAAIAALEITGKVEVIKKSVQIKR